MNGETWTILTLHRFDGRTIRVDKAADKPPRSNGGFQGRGGYNSRGGDDSQYSRGGYGALYSYSFLFYFFIFFVFCAVFIERMTDNFQAVVTTLVTVVDTKR